MEGGQGSNNSVQEAVQVPSNRGQRRNGRIYRQRVVFPPPGRGNSGSHGGQGGRLLPREDSGSQPVTADRALGNRGGGGGRQERGGKKSRREDRGGARSAGDYNNRNSGRGREDVERGSYHSSGRNQHRHEFYRRGAHTRIGFENRQTHAGVLMKFSTKDCLICCQRSDLCAIGICNHSMCMECGIRACILGKSNMCPQCRTDLGTLYFMTNHDEKIPTETVDCEEATKYGVKFESEYALECFRSYLAHRCPICCKRENDRDAFSFPNFAALQQHMTRVHQLSFCYLCTDNLNKLTNDRLVYNREELQLHMNGEINAKDDDGFHGHPKCLFCEERFYDEEFQYRHLRKEHFYCQLCDADGADNFFYKSHNALIHHYKKAHFPCNHQECVTLGIVFGTQVELNVHNAKEHTRSGRKHIHLSFGFGTSGTGGESSSTLQATAQVPPPPTPIFTIVPSAQTNQPVRCFIPSATVNAKTQPDQFPLLEQFQQLQPPYGAPLNWKKSQQTLAINNTHSAPCLPLQSGEQFPGLPTSSSRVNATNASSSVWAKCNTRQLFAKQPFQRSAPSSSAASEKRKKVIPLPDIFPEGMREVLRTRQLGLPESVPPHEFSLADKYEEVKRQEKAQKRKEKKTKRVSAAVLTNKIADAKYVPSASSRFESLQVESSEDEKDELGRSKNWWTSSNKTTAPTLHESSDDFVRIDVGKHVSHRRAPPSNNAIDTTPIEEPLTMRAIAEMLYRVDEEKNEKEKKEEASKIEKEKQEKLLSWPEDEMELLRHQRKAYNNDYSINNEDLDIQLALELSLLSSKLFMPPSVSTTSSINELVTKIGKKAALSRSGNSSGFKNKKASKDVDAKSDNNKNTEILLPQEPSTTSKALIADKNDDLACPPGFSSCPPGFSSADKRKNIHADERDKSSENGSEQTPWANNIFSGLFSALKK